MKRKLLYIPLATCLIAGGALGGTLLSANAASKSKAKSARAAQPPGSFKSNEDPAHEQSESAAREKAEDSGQMPPGGPGDGDGHRHGGGDGDGDGHFTPNTDPAHERAESPERAAEEKQLESQNGASSPSASSGASTQQ